MIRRITRGRAGLVLAGAVLLAAVALAVTVIAPASDAELTSDEGARTYTAQTRRGAALYRNEGCWYCHTQQVRPQDDVYGEPAGPASYAHDRPAMLGAERIGPDLTYVGSRTAGASELVRLLRDGGRGMPGYKHLSDAELQALAAYLLSLK